jgi:uncharacterized protein YkwD
MNIRRAIPGFLLVVLVFAACKPAQTNVTPPVSPPVLEEAGPAKVERVEVLQLENAGDAPRAVLSGMLSDECSRLEDAQVTYADFQFTIQLGTRRLSGVTCSGQPETFERVIPLANPGLESGQYTVVANGVSTTFTVARPVQQAALAVAPAANPTLVPAETEAALPVTGGPTPSAPQAPAEAATTSNCENKAAFFSDVTIPDGTVLEPGKTFTKTWRLRNEGTCAWDAGYRFIFTSGDSMGAKDAVPMPSTQPGQLVDISVDMVTPNAAGAYTGNWLIEDASGKQFGVNSGGIDLIWVKIVSNALPPAPEPPGSTASCASLPNGDYLQRVLALMNQERASRSLGALQLDNRLSAAANVHSVDMACNNFLAHYGFDGSTWFDRIAAQGYSYATASENIYAGNPAFGGDADGAMVWWMNSQVHRDAILNPKFTQVGIGYASHEGSQYGGYFTVVFAKPK